MLRRGVVTCHTRKLLQDIESEYCRLELDVHPSMSLKGTGV
jgi:hypothetical protein